MNDCSLFDASVTDVLSFGHPGEDDTSALTLPSEEDNSIVERSEHHDSDEESDEESLSSHEDAPLASNVIISKADDDLMARLAGSFLNKEESDSEEESDSDSDLASAKDFDTNLSLDAASRLGLSANTNVAVMMKTRVKESMVHSLGGDSSHIGGKGRTRRHRCSRRMSNATSEPEQGIEPIRVPLVST